MFLSTALLLDDGALCPAIRRSRVGFLLRNQLSAIRSVSPSESIGSKLVPSLVSNKTLIKFLFFKYFVLLYKV